TRARCRPTGSASWSGAASPWSVTSCANRRARCCAPMAKAAASATDAMHGLLCYCRQGFESDLAAELGERAAAAGVPGYARAERDAGHVRFITADAGDAAALARALPFRDLVFARQKLRLL